MKVYFDGGFWGHKKYQKPMRKLDAQKEFQWKGYRWRLLAVYVCGKGLVLDFAREVPVEDIKGFLRKWKEVIRRLEEGEEPSVAVQGRMEYENPTETGMYCKAWVNEREVNQIRGCGTGYCPPGVVESVLRETAAANEGRKVKEEQKDGGDMPKTADAAEEFNPEAAELMEAYQLDTSCGWSFYRMTLEWAYRRIPGNLKLRLALLPDHYSLPCEPAFETVTGEGERRVAFIHPLDGTVHELVVESVEQDSLPENTFEQEVLGREERYLFPRHFQKLRYHLEEDEERKQFRVRDTEPGDKPARKSEQEGVEPWEKGAAAVGIIVRTDESAGIIGGADGPTSVFVAGKVHGEQGQEGQVSVNPKQQSCYSASRLCFEPVTRTRWQVMADVSRGREMTLELDLSGR